MTIETSTSYEYVGEGYFICIQHCQHIHADGTYCDKYLGVNYPDYYCDYHRPSK